MLAGLIHAWVIVLLIMSSMLMYQQHEIRSLAMETRLCIGQLGKHCDRSSQEPKPVYPLGAMAQ